MPHALHMPSHTFIALGLWEDSIRVQSGSQCGGEEAGLGAGGAAHHGLPGVRVSAERPRTEQPLT